MSKKTKAKPADDDEEMSLAEWIKKNMPEAEIIVYNAEDNKFVNWDNVVNGELGNASNTFATDAVTGATKQDIELEQYRIQMLLAAQSTVVQDIELAKSGGNNTSLMEYTHYLQKFIDWLATPNGQYNKNVEPMHVCNKIEFGDDGKPRICKWHGIGLLANLQVLESVFTAYVTKMQYLAGFKTFGETIDYLTAQNRATNK